MRRPLPRADRYTSRSRYSGESSANGSARNWVRHCVMRSCNPTTWPSVKRYTGKPVVSRHDGFGIEPRLVDDMQAYHAGGLARGDARQRGAEIPVTILFGYGQLVTGKAISPERVGDNRPARFGHTRQPAQGCVDFIILRQPFKIGRRVSRPRPPAAPPAPGETGRGRCGRHAGSFPPNCQPVC